MRFDMLFVSPETRDILAGWQYSLGLEEHAMPERNAAEDRAKILEKYPDYVIAVRPTTKHIQVVAGGEVIADTERALEMDESYHEPVYYLPRGDVRMDALTPTAHETFCPFKGTASYCR